jgi:hypothetical protein
MRIRLFIWLGVLLLPLPLLANTYTYSYTGKDFSSVKGSYTKNDDVTVSFTVASPLAANSTYSYGNTTGGISLLSISASDGVDSASSLSDILFFVIETSSTGSISEWVSFLYWTDSSTKKTDEIVTQNDPADGPVEDFGSYSSSKSTYTGKNTNLPGTWVETAATPEPGSFLLLGTGLLGLGAICYRRRFRII